MKRVNLISAIILLLAMAGCGGGKQSTDGLITVDVTKSYPKKELILQDFLDVEYILLDDINDDFITTGAIMHIGKEIILVRNRSSDGNIFVFDKNGTGLRVINRRGLGPEEYPNLMIAYLDEDNNEMYVYTPRGIVTYDLFGTFKRRLNLEYSLFTIPNFDQDNFISMYNYNFESMDELANRFLIISKQDGSVAKEIQIPY